MYSVIKGIKIEAIAAGVPDRWLSIEEQFGYEGSGIDGRTMKKFKKSIGIEGRYVSNEKQTSSDWCYAAADNILSEKNIDRKKVGVLVYVTQTADYREPATAMVLQHRLKVGMDCIAFDINLGCSGFVYGLNVVGSLMKQCDAQYGLLMCGETGSRKKIFDESAEADTDAMLFGDAGSAALLVKDETAPGMHFMSKSKGDGFKLIIDPWESYRNPVRLRNTDYMDGIAVFGFSTNEVPELISELMECMHTSPRDYDYLVLHQANKLIMQQIEKRTGFSEENSLKAIDKFANTSSASIPVAMVHNLAGSEDQTAHFLLCGYGIGLSWSAVDCYINKKDILPLVETADYFEDGYQMEK